LNFVTLDVLFLKKNRKNITTASNAVQPTAIPIMAPVDSFLTDPCDPDPCDPNPDPDPDPDPCDPDPCEPGPDGGKMLIGFASLGIGQWIGDPCG